ncbi:MULTISPECIES: GNAT family N-acetyltransferase [Wolbachia]|uniref:GNAT family N-acetyltransferase n=3 Tax=Wolbachia TaxID=953 RepID=A0AAT9GBX8_9RICK|nr:MULTISPECIES: GNAT family N-acetyltransferase [Wolbachia]EEH12151.1 acetyltransferase, GNAT family [Wolbachia endosymbiont of Muscidifurax uniraptor]ONI56415.1 acetyltransferase family protein [Wolbachia pipientis wUni]ONI57011.1 acetyltransferase family protein [Wolbachia pipientis wVitA]UJQ21297.1 GNAT family N-acetyltransferase [Wolbachia endosymbiont of Delia radicum]UZE38151.1 GNAT family N-acetyltransferase [Wolbachia endosymbiont of Drosophila pseudotakahashii]
MKIEHTTSPSSKDIEFLLKKINEETVDKGTCNPFAFFIRDDTEQIIAGCSGFVIYGSIYTDLLWVHSDYRRKGMGKQLMEEVHDYGREMHCKIATVATMNFQKAKVFYEKLGYKCDLVRPGYVNMYIFEESVVRCTVK